jgi:hypothetical protein
VCDRKHLGLHRNRLGRTGQSRLPDIHLFLPVVPPFYAHARIIVTTSSKSSYFDNSEFIVVYIGFGVLDPAAWCMIAYVETGTWPSTLELVLTCMESLAPQTDSGHLNAASLDTALTAEISKRVCNVKVIKWLKQWIIRLYAFSQDKSSMIGCCGEVMI